MCQPAEDDTSRPVPSDSEAAASQPPVREERRRRSQDRRRVTVRDYFPDPTQLARLTDAQIVKRGFDPASVRRQAIEKVESERRYQLVRAARERQDWIDSAPARERQAEIERQGWIARTVLSERGKNDFPHQLNLLRKRQALLFACRVLWVAADNDGRSTITMVEKVACEGGCATFNDVGKYASLVCYLVANSVAHPPGPTEVFTRYHHEYDYQETERGMCAGGEKSELAITTAHRYLARAANIDLSETAIIVENIGHLVGESECRRNPGDCHTWHIALEEAWRGIDNLFTMAYRGGKTFPSEWATTSTLSIARQIFDDRDFALMPILGDALEDAGCDDDDLLGHLRNDRGLWGRSDWALYNLVFQDMT